MPLVKSPTRKAFSENVSEMMHAGHPQKQALAAAYRNARKYGAKFANGGGVNVSGVNRNPTEAQKEAGNYKKAHVNVHGLDIAIENPRGSTRRGVSDDGKPWSVKMPDHYGYIKRSEGADGDHVDCYVGDNLSSNRVFIVNQQDADTKKFDEHKVMLGYPSKDSALSAYKRAFSDGRGHERIGSVKEMS